MSASPNGPCPYPGEPSVTVTTPCLFSSCSPCYPFVIYIVGLGQNEKTAFFSFSAQGKVPLCTYCSIRCTRDNNPPHESFVGSDSRDRMSYHHHPKSHLQSIT